MKDLFGSAMSKTEVARYGSLVMIVVAGEGAALVPHDEFRTAQKWALARRSLGSVLRDRLMFLDRLETIVARPNAFCGTKGHEKRLRAVLLAMREQGLDPREWSLPRRVLEEPQASTPSRPEEPQVRIPLADEPPPAQQDPPLEGQPFFVRERKRDD